MGWPRPSFPGDFIAAKFYNVTTPTFAITGVAQTIARLEIPANHLFTGDLYQFWFGPFFFQGNELGISLYSSPTVGGARTLVRGEVVIDNYAVGPPANFHAVPMLHAFYTATSFAPIVFEIDVRSLSGASPFFRYARTLFGISAVAHGSSYADSTVYP